LTTERTGGGGGGGGGGRRRAHCCAGRRSSSSASSRRVRAACLLRGVFVFLAWRVTRDGHHRPLTSHRPLKPGGGAFVVHDEE